MTERDLNKIHYINIEIKRLKKDLEEIKEGSYIGSQQLSGMPFVGGISDKTGQKALERIEIEELINIKISELHIVRSRIERFLDTIEDDEVRLIVRLRSINNMRWEDIGHEVGMERTTVSKKYRAFIKNQSFNNE